MQFKKRLVHLAYGMEASLKYKKFKNFAYEILEDHRSIRKKYFDIFMIFLVLSTILILILEIKNNLPPIVYYYEIIAVIIFIIEWLGRLWVSSDGHKIVIKTYEEAKAKEIQLSSFGLMKSALKAKGKFVISPMSIIDLLAIIPTYRPLRVLRFFLLFRLFKVFRYTKSINFLLRVFVEKRFEFMTLFVLFAFMVFFASTVIYIFEGTGENEKIDNFYDAIYWAVITITTVGYGDISPMTPVGRFVTMFLIIGGIGIISFMTSIMTTAMTQKLEEVKSHHAISEVAKLKEYILICGYGKMGEVLAREFEEERRDFVIIDIDVRCIDEAKENGYIALCANSSDIEILKELQVDVKVRFAAVLMGNDATNLSVILSLRSLSETITIFARSNALEAKRKLEIAGASGVIFPYASAAYVGVEHFDMNEEAKRVVIFGYGQTAKELAKGFKAQTIGFRIIVADERKKFEAEEDGFEATVANLSEDQHLIMIGVGEGLDMLYCLCDSYEENLFVTLSARNLDKHLKIISLSATKDESKKMVLAGANHTISPYEIGAIRIARLVKKREKERREGI